MLGMTLLVMVEGAMFAEGYADRPPFDWMVGGGLLVASGVVLLLRRERLPPSSR